MLIDWLVSIVYLGVLLSWAPETWTVSLLQVGIFIIGGVFLARRMIAKETLAFPADAIALGLLVSWGPLQIAAGRTVSRFDTWNSATNWLMVAVVYFVAKAALSDRVVRARFLSIQVWAGTALAIISVLFLFSSPMRVFGVFESRYMAFGPFIYKNHFAVFIELLLPITFYKIVSSDRYRLPYIVAFAALFACMVASLSRGGVVVAVAETLVLLLLSGTRGKLPVMTLLKIALPVVILIFVFTLIVGWDALVRRFQEPHPFEHRIELVQSTLEMIKAEPVTGFGLGTWRTVYPQFAYFDMARLANEAHNDWLQWASEGGIGFAAIILFFAAWVSRFAWNHLWGLGVPAVFLHCLVDYPTRNPSLDAMIFLFAGALASTAAAKKARAKERSAEWQVLSVRTAPE